jgi:peptidoglycan/LPS O-acetylase OafA/YrhL
MVFVTTMAVMASLGAYIASTKLHISFQKFNVMAGIFTVYLVVTALLTVRAHPGKRWMDFAAFAVALGIAIFSLGLATLGLMQAKFSWFPTVPAVIFGTVALLAAFGDARMLRAGGLQGRHRIARHLWRMCVALFVATGSFFMGQAKVFPEEIRILPLLAAPMFLVLIAMFYWWVRVLTGKWSARPRTRKTSAPPLGRETPA